MLIRPATPPEAMAVANVHVRAWQAGYRELLPHTYLDALRPEDRASRYRFDDPSAEAPRTIVAVGDEGIRGFATIAARETCIAGHGELCALHVDPDWWGREIGVALVADARRRLRVAGCGGIVAWILDGNARAERFYRRDGWHDDGARRTETIWGATVDERRFVRAL